MGLVANAEKTVILRYSCGPLSLLRAGYNIWNREGNLSVSRELLKQLVTRSMVGECMKILQSAYLKLVYSLSGAEDICGQL